MSIRERRRWEAYKQDVDPVTIKAAEPLAQAKRRKEWERSKHQEKHKDLSTTEKSRVSEDSLCGCASRYTNADRGNSTHRCKSEVYSFDNEQASDPAVNVRLLQKRQAFMQRRSRNVEEKRLRSKTPSILEETLDKVCRDSKSKLVGNGSQVRFVKDSTVRKIEKIYQMAKEYLTVVKFEVPNMSRVFKSTNLRPERLEDVRTYRSYSLIQEDSLGDSDGGGNGPGRKSSQGTKACSANIQPTANSTSYPSNDHSIDINVGKVKVKEAKEGKSPMPVMPLRKRSPTHEHYRQGGSDLAGKESRTANNPDVDELKGRTTQITLPSTRENQILDKGEGSSWRPPKNRRPRKSKVNRAAKGPGSLSEETTGGKLLGENDPKSRDLPDSDDVHTALSERFGRSYNRGFHMSVGHPKREPTTNLEQKKENGNSQPPPGLSTPLEQSKSSMPSSKLQAFASNALNVLDRHVRSCQDMLSIAKASRTDVDCDFLRTTSVDKFFSGHEQMMEDVGAGATNRLEKAQQRLQETEEELKKVMVRKRAQKEERKRLRKEAYDKVLANLKADHSRIVGILEEGTDEDLYVWLKHVWDQLAEVELVKVKRDESWPGGDSCRWM